MSIQLVYAAQSHVGLVRKNNQDSGYAGPNLLVMADGMGGPAGGDIASSVAVAHLAPLDADSHRADDLLELLRGAISAAHDDLVRRSQNHQELAGLGTTCIAILRSGNKLAMVHVGDSRAYLLRDKQLTQVTTDHSFVQYLVQTGELTAEQAENHPQRSVLTRVLGDMTSEVTLDESVREAVVGDRWLLCSDGLSGVVSFDTISEVLSTTAEPEECCSQLVELALRAGGPDNVTCVVADVVDSEERLGTTDAQIVGAAGTGQGSSLIKGHTPAQKAAALSNAHTKNGPDKADTPPDPRVLSVRSKLIGIGIALVVLAGAWFGLSRAYAWTQTQQFLGLNNHSVTLFKGINQSVGPWKLYSPQQDMGVKDSELIPAVRERLEQTVTVQDRGEAEKLLKSWLEMSQKDTALTSTDPASAQNSDTPSGGQ